MRENPQETADLVTFTEKNLNGKLHFCVVLLLRACIINMRKELVPRSLLKLRGVYEQEETLKNKHKKKTWKKSKLLENLNLPHKTKSNYLPVLICLVYCILVILHSSCEILISGRKASH